MEQAIAENDIGTHLKTLDVGNDLLLDTPSDNEDPRLVSEDQFDKREDQHVVITQQSSFSMKHLLEHGLGEIKEENYTSFKSSVVDTEQNLD